MFRRLSRSQSATNTAAIPALLLLHSIRYQSSNSAQQPPKKSSSGGNSAPSSVNNVTLVGVVHDIQTGFVYEDRVTQFVVTTTSIDTTNPAQECIVEKDHHTVRCYGDAFAEDVRGRLKEGAVVCVSGRLRLNPQLEPSCGRHFYFPFLHVTPPHGGVALVHGDRRRPPPTQSPPIPTASSSSAASQAQKEQQAEASAKGEEMAAAAAETKLDEKPTAADNSTASSTSTEQPLSESAEPKSSEPKAE